MADLVDSGIQAPVADRAPAPQGYWFSEVWRGFRPFFIKFIEDSLIFVCVWLMLFAVHKLAELFPNDGPAGAFLLSFHGTALSLGVVLWSALTLWDLYNLKSENHGK
jgi:hypothetical protein